MSKKLLKARYSNTSSSHHEKPLSIVEPLKVKSLSFLGLSKVEEAPPLSKHPLGRIAGEGSQWEYKPWVSSSPSATSGSHRHYEFRSRPNLGQLSQTPRGFFPSSMSSSSNINPSIFLPKGNEDVNYVNCDTSSDSSNCSTNSSSLDFKSALVEHPDQHQLNFNSAIKGLQQAAQKEEHSVFQTSQINYAATTAPNPRSTHQTPSSMISNIKHKSDHRYLRTQDHEKYKTSQTRQRKKEDNLLPKNCKYSRFEIVDAPIDTFNKLLEKLPNEEKMVFKDSRRKGKNRGAARRARDRRIRQHDDLLKQKEVVLQELSAKKQELKNLEKDCSIWAKLVDTINYSIRALESKLK